MRCKAWLFPAVAATAIAGCGGGLSSGPPGPQAAMEASRRLATTSPSPIQHVVLMIQENRTFNNFFATYPGADGTTTGAVVKDASCQIAKGTIPLTESNLIVQHDLNHDYQEFSVARNHGHIDGFDRIRFANDVPECAYPYQYVNPSQIQPYWAMAKQYALAEHMFTTQGSSSFTAHQDLIAGGTGVAPNEALVNLPTCSGPACVWGCDAPPGTHTSLITRDGHVSLGRGPFPCLKYATLRDLLDAQKVSWRYYVPPMCCQTYGRLMSAFDAIRAVRYGPEWTDGHISSPQTNIFSDISGGTLPAVSWLIPDEVDSDHPGTKSDSGPSWVASVVNAIGESPYWNSTAIIIVWDDWGGLYDNLDPLQRGYGGLGFRVPAMVISPYAKAGFISQTQYEFGSILKYVEENWNLGSLGTSDKRANSLIDCFNYAQTPITFSPIPSKYSKGYFLHKKPSYLPVDTDM